MGKRVVALNVVALGAALGLFVWANTRPEMLIVEQFDGHSYHVIRNGPGWPVRAWATDQRGTWAYPVPADHLLPDPCPDDRARARGEVWLLNGPIGILLLAALAQNVRWLFRPPDGQQRHAEPGETLGPSSP
ncbi:hypothetical protein [Limnoglobus roseus]|uniref:Uncharacterized protein n=1 Tax=Limnoglobus roseus TaxID=2598579 RepID=A0A5C1ABR6_9BACT|nr:hypothetical protein [Limnoglobus roseus]QEL15613.1 hypothetical protein PX52LOC_02546 [Limnoglobus roseus]